MKSWWHEGFPMPVGKQRCELPWWTSAFKAVMETHYACTRDRITFLLHLKSNGRVRQPEMEWPCNEEWSIFCFTSLHVELVSSMQQLLTCSERPASTFFWCVQSSCTSVIFASVFIYKTLFYFEAMSNLQKNVGRVQRKKFFHWIIKKQLPSWCPIIFGHFSVFPATVDIPLTDHDKTTQIRKLTLMHYYYLASNTLQVLWIILKLPFVVKRSRSKFHITFSRREWGFFSLLTFSWTFVSFEDYGEVILWNILNLCFSCFLQIGFSLCLW